MRHCLAQELEAVVLLFDARTDPERAEKQEMEARFAFASAEYAVFATESGLDIDPNFLSKIFQKRIDAAQANTEAVIVDAKKRETKWNALQKQYTDDRTDIMEHCGRAACLAASLSRAVGLDPLACGSSSERVSVKKRELRGTGQY